MKIDTYIESERDADSDSRGVPRDACVLVINGTRFNFGGHADKAAATIAREAVLHALKCAAVEANEGLESAGSGTNRERERERGRG